MEIKTGPGSSSRHYKGFLRAATIVIFVLMAALPLLYAAPALAQSVSISASSGAPGSAIIITGTAFNNGDTYQIIFAPSTSYEQILVPTTSISGTSFSETVTVPNVPYAQYTIRVATNRGNFSLLLNVTAIIELNANSGYVGDTILVSGSGFRANRSINIYFNNSTVTTTATNANGVLNPVSFQVPAIRNGTYNVYASDGTVTSPLISFAVKPHLTASAALGNVGDPVRLDGAGFDDNSGITVLWDNQPMNVSGVFTNAVGSFTANIVIPASPRGNHAIRARDNTSGTDVVTFLVNPKIVISPTSGTSGNSINITGSGFRAGVAVVISYDSNSIPTQPTTLATDSSGSFAGTFTVPSILAGNYTIRASDGVYSSTAALTVASKIALNTTSGNVGTEVMVTGSGFTPLGRVAINYDSLTVLTVDASGGGAFSVSFKVPASAAGQHSITARDLATEAVTASATFTMEATPPPNTTLLTPQYDSQTNVQPRFNWSTVTDPSGVTYDLQVARDPNFSQLVLFKQGLTPAEYQVGPSEELQLTKRAKPYYWRARAVDGAGNIGAWTGPASFYTEDSTPPGVPSTLGPPNDAQVELRPVLSWSPVSDPGNVTYDIQIARDANFSQLVLSKQGLTQTQYQLAPSEQLQLTKRANPYYWRIRAVDDAANPSDWTSPAQLYTEDSTPPPTPAALNPGNGAEKKGNVLFEWSAVSDPAGVTYTLEVAQDSGFTYLVISKEGLNVTQYQLAKSEELTRLSGNPTPPYYWRVRATDGAENASDWSAVNLFYIGGFQWTGWVVYVIDAIAGMLLLVIGIFIGTRLRPREKVA